MKTMWFQQRFVADILAGRKRDTIRPPSSRLPAVGDVVALSVGPRAPFAHARIVSISRVRIARLSASRRAQLAEIYGEKIARLVRLRFLLQQAPCLQQVSSQARIAKRRSAIAEHGAPALVEPSRR